MCCASQLYNIMHNFCLWQDVLKSSCSRWVVFHFNEHRPAGLHTTDVPISLLALISQKAQSRPDASTLDHLSDSPSKLHFPLSTSFFLSILFVFWTCWCIHYGASNSYSRVSHGWMDLNLGEKEWVFKEWHSCRMERFSVIPVLPGEPLG